MTPFTVYLFKIMMPQLSKIEIYFVKVKVKFSLCITMY